MFGLKVATLRPMLSQNLIKKLYFLEVIFSIYFHFEELIFFLNIFFGLNVATMRPMFGLEVATLRPNNAITEFNINLFFS